MSIDELVAGVLVAKNKIKLIEKDDKDLAIKLYQEIIDELKNLIEDLSQWFGLSPEERIKLGIDKPD